MRKQYVKVHISGTPIVRHLLGCPVALYELSSCLGPRMFRDGQSLLTFLASQEGRCSPHDDVRKASGTIACASGSAEAGVGHDSNIGAYPLGLFFCRLGSLSDRFANDPLKLFDRIL